MSGAYRPAGAPGKQGLFGRRISAWGGTAALHASLVVAILISPFLAEVLPLVSPPPPPFVWIVPPPPEPPAPPPEKEKPHFVPPTPEIPVLDPPAKKPTNITLRIDGSRTCQVLREALQGRGGTLGFGWKDEAEMAVLVDPANGQRLTDDSVSRRNRWAIEVNCDGWLKEMRSSFQVPGLQAYALFPEDMEFQVMGAVKTVAKAQGKADTLVAATITFDAAAPWFQVLDVIANGN
jgi:hypothetical protein